MGKLEDTLAAGEQQTQLLPQAAPRPQPLFGRAHRAQLYGQQEELIDTSVATNRAYTETQALAQDRTMPSRVATQRKGNVEDEAIRILADRLHEQDIETFDALNPERLASMSMDERFAVGTDLLAKLNYNSLTSRDLALFHVYSQGGDNLMVPVEGFDQWQRQDLSRSDVSRLRQNMNEKQSKKMRQAVDAYAATKGFENYGDMFIQAGQQDMIPFYAAASRVGLTKKLLEAAGGKPVEGLAGFFAGEIKQETRRHLLSLPPQERYQAILSMVEVVKQMEKSPIYGPLITNYNVLEQFEGIFTEGVFLGTSDENKMDRFFSNLDVALESVFSVFILGKLASKGMRAAFSATDAVKARTIAKSAGQGGKAADMDVVLQDDSLAMGFGLKPDETVPALLPKPTPFVDDLDALPEGAKRVQVQSEGIRSEVLASTEGFTGAGLNAVDKSKQVSKNIEALDLVDDMVVHPKMSTYGRLVDDVGFEVEVVVGQTAKGGWQSIEDVIADTLRVDPNLEVYEVVRVSEFDKIESVFASRDELLASIPEFGGKYPSNTLPNPPFKQEFYLRAKIQKFWHTADKASLAPDTISNSPGWIPRFALPPNAKFGPDLYGNILKNYMGQQVLRRNLENLFEPYQKLGLKDKRAVDGMFEWMEDFSKDMVANGKVGYSPTMSDVIEQFGEVTEKQMKGLISMREGMDTMHDLFNRRLYRELQSRGAMTARPKVGSMPTYHGMSLEMRGGGIRRADGRSAGNTFLDPNTGEVRTMSKKDIQDLYNDGGRVMELDVGVDTVSGKRAQADLVIIDRSGYELGELSTSPLTYHPGYTFRFYDDPYYVIKKTNGATLNGVARTGDNAVHSEAIWTAGSKLEGESKIRRIEFEEGVEWEVVPMRDISQTENTLMQKQVLHREGRMFWDDRNFDRLPDVNGNRSRLMDNNKAVERGVALAASQTASEDLTKGLKKAFSAEYADLAEIRKADLAQTDLHALSKQLRAKMRNITDSKLKKRYLDAAEIVEYFRLMSGVDSSAVPVMRSAALGVTHALHRWSGGRASNFFGRAENWFQSFNPFRMAQSAAFHAFMVTRPLRQLVLQSAQIGYLSPLAPGYVASGKLFRDSYHLRRGIAKRKIAGYSDGISVGGAAKAMGLTTKEYRLLMKEFDRSGIMALVDVHSFAGGASKFHKQALPRSGVGKIGYKARQYGRGTLDWMKKYGFDRGEGYNLSFTYALALHRQLKKGGKSLLEWSRADWDKLRVDASDLALGMIRPNSFAYQNGAWAVTTQFMSFSHKAMLGLVGGNPAIKGLDAARVVAGTYMLYGANMFGARDFVEETLTAMGLTDQAIPGADGSTLVDLLSAGIVETTFNRFWDLTSSDYKDLDLEFMAPGLNFARMWDMQLGMLARQPGKVVFGPFGNVFSRVLQSFDFVSSAIAGNPDLDPADKLTYGANAIMAGTFPMYNDTMNAYIGWQADQWYRASGEALPLRPTFNGLIARGFFGARTREEIGLYRLERKIWESKEEMTEIVKANQQWYTTLINRHYNGELSYDLLRNQVHMLANMYESFPEAKRAEVLERSMVERLDNGKEPPAYLFRKLAQEHGLDPDTAAIIDRFPDIPEQTRSELKSFAKETWERQLKTDEAVHQRLEELE